MAKVPASSRSGRTVSETPCSRSTPSTVIVGEPSPLMQRAHPVEHVPQEDDLRLAGGVDDRRAPAGQRGRHEQILGAGVARVVHVDGDAAQPGGAPGDLLAIVVEVDGGAHLAEAAHVDVDRASAELATAGGRGRHLAASRQQRTGDQERGAHGGDELGRSVGVNDVGGTDADAFALAVVLGLGAETPQQREHRADVGEIGNIAEDALVGREQCRRQSGQGGVLGATDSDGAAQRDAPADAQHPFSRSGIGSDRAPWCLNRRRQRVLLRAGLGQSPGRLPALKRIP